MLSLLYRARGYTWSTLLRPPAVYGVRARAVAADHRGDPPAVRPPTVFGALSTALPPGLLSSASAAALRRRLRQPLAPMDEPEPEPDAVLLC